MNCDLLFVYGTLRRGSGTEMHRRLAAEAEFVSAATFRGRLFLVDDYPGAIPSDTSSDIVLGDLYRLCRPEHALDWIDQYEQCGDRFPAPQEYIRQIRQICLPDGSVCEAWVYLYNQPVERRPSLPSGDFFADPQTGPHQEAAPFAGSISPRRSSRRRGRGSVGAGGRSGRA